MTTSSEPAGGTAIDARLLKAIGHPVRFRILEQLTERPASPAEVAQVIGMPTQHVSYHFSVLAENGAIEFVGTKPSKGAVKRVYRATERPWLDDSHWMQLPPAIRAALFNDILNGMWEHVVEGARAGGFEDPKTHASWTTLDLDREGYAAVCDLLEETLERVVAVQAESAERVANMPEDERQTERTEVAILHYHRPRQGKGARVLRQEPASVGSVNSA
jgi:DNA-binding transcriptional ArsR family regulator